MKQTSRFVSILAVLFIWLNTIPCFAQKVEHDVDKDGYRILSTASTSVLTPEDSHFPISISLNYYGNEKVEQYILRLYGRYELTKDTKLALLLDDDTEILLKAYTSNIYHSRLGLIREVTIYDALYQITDEQLNNLITKPIVAIKIKTQHDWMGKTFKHNRIGKWLQLNYKEIGKKLNPK